MYLLPVAYEYCFHVALLPSNLLILATGRRSTWKTLLPINKQANFVARLSFLFNSSQTMASKLCCIAEEDERAGSPDLPNVRLSQPVSTKQPPIPTETNSSNSHFTNDRSGDLYELNDIFHNADHREDDRPTPIRPVRARFSRPSLHSIRSLHKTTSIRSIIKRKLSKDFYKRKSPSPVQHTQARDESPKSPPDTVIKQQKRASRHQVQITKDDLRNNLLSHKKPHQGGYDSDAQVLDDVARNIGKKSPNKRPSIHSVDWVTTPGR